MYILTVWIASIAMMLGTIWYCYCIAIGRMKPPLATFIILSCTFPLALYMYMQNPESSFTANIGLTAAVVSVWMVFVVLLITLIVKRKLHVELSLFHKLTIFASILILGFWFITNDDFVAYVLLQISALIGYIPVVAKLWKAKENMDSIIFWTSILISSCVASYAAWERNDVESWIYIARAVPSTLFVVILMARLEIRPLKLSS